MIKRLTIPMWFRGILAPFKNYVSSLHKLDTSNTLIPKTAGFPSENYITCQVPLQLIKHANEHLANLEMWLICREAAGSASCGCRHREATGFGGMLWLFGTLPHYCCLPLIQAPLHCLSRPARQGREGKVQLLQPRSTPNTLSRTVDDKLSA